MEREEIKRRLFKVGDTVRFTQHDATTPSLSRHVVARLDARNANDPELYPITRCGSVVYSTDERNPASNLELCNRCYEVN